MGEVWLAEDTRLGREVALKVLPDELADDPERKERLERAARPDDDRAHAILGDVEEALDLAEQVERYLRALPPRQSRV